MSTADSVRDREQAAKARKSNRLFEGVIEICSAKKNVFKNKGRDRSQTVIKAIFLICQSLCPGLETPLGKNQGNHPDGARGEYVSIGLGRLDQKGHGEPSGDIGHNSVADTVAGEYDGPDSFLVGSRWVNLRDKRGKPIGANDGMNSVEEAETQYGHRLSRVEELLSRTGNFLFWESSFAVQVLFFIQTNPHNLTQKFGLVRRTALSCAKYLVFNQGLLAIYVSQAGINPQIPPVHKCCHACNNHKYSSTSEEVELLIVRLISEETVMRVQPKGRLPCRFSSEEANTMDGCCSEATVPK
ncbi:hypothetical protein C8R44DRAFT_750975 [Mycena epipterygia]|nr:hypothetical protein C8R44DRAFT_750975 [Mycena epipterygia]